MPSESLPPGWEAKYDPKSGRTYYINHVEKTTTWDHPGKNNQKSKSGIQKQANGSSKQAHLNVDHIQLQGSPDLRRNYVYPSQPFPIPAFQVSPQQSPKIMFQDLGSKTRGSPLSVRSRETSFTNTEVVDEAVSKISAMFPTVSEPHIRLLMKKYHNREVLVISALQVEKNPLTTPGPFATPPPQRNILPQYTMTPPLGSKINYMNIRCGGGGSGPSSLYNGSPRIGDNFRSFIKPHSSPKLKLRYMKSIYPEAEETIILDILANNDNNIQKTSETLNELGFAKKDTFKISQQKQQQQQIDKLKEYSKKETQPIVIKIPRVKSAEEKSKVKVELQNEHKNVPEQLISMALESVDFDREKASELLKNSMEESGKIVEKPEVENEGAAQSSLPISQSRQSIKSLLKNNTEKNMKESHSFTRVIEESKSYKSYLSNTKGPNPSLAKGINEKLLLEDYVKWQGPNPSLCKGPSNLSKGPNLLYRAEKSSRSRGPNPSYSKGPNRGLAKGSIFQQMKDEEDEFQGESRGK